MERTRSVISVAAASLIIAFIWAGPSPGAQELVPMITPPPEAEHTSSERVLLALQTSTWRECQVCA